MNVFETENKSCSARHAARNSTKFAPMKLYLIDEPAADTYADFACRHRASFRPTQAAVRPATNMSVIRQTVARHLNVAVPVSADQRQAEREQLREARERKKNKLAMWN